MDPISIVVAALAAGASAGLTETVSNAIKDAYAGLKRLVALKFPTVDISPVERMPSSEAKRQSLAEDISGVGDDATADEELLAAARRLIQAVRADKPDTASAIGVDLQRLEAESLRVHTVSSTGVGVRVTDSKISGPVDIGNVHAGHAEADPKGP